MPILFLIWTILVFLLGFSIGNMLDIKVFKRKTGMIIEEEVEEKKSKKEKK